jgi:hypothetical protein
LHQLRNNGLRPGSIFEHEANGTAARATSGSAMSPAFKPNSAGGVFGISFEFKDAVSSAISISFCPRRAMHQWTRHAED